jgi:hypothetical protein
VTSIGVKPERQDMASQKLRLWHAEGNEVVFDGDETRFPRTQVEEWLRKGWCHHSKGYEVHDDGGYLYFTNLDLFALVTDVNPDLRWALCPECFCVNVGLSCCLNHRAQAQKEDVPISKYRSIDDE